MKLFCKHDYIWKGFVPIPDHRGHTFLEYSYEEIICTKCGKICRLYGYEYGDSPFKVKKFKKAKERYWEGKNG